MALLSTLKLIKESLTLESYAILRESASKKSQYHTFVKEIVLNSPNNFKFCARDTGFCAEVKNLLQYPDEEIIQIYDLLVNLVKTLSRDKQEYLFPAREIEFPELTSDRLLELKKVFEEIKSNNPVYTLNNMKINKQDFTEECLKFSSEIENMNAEEFYITWYKLPETKKEDILQKFLESDIESFNNLADYVMMRS